MKKIIIIAMIVLLMGSLLPGVLADPQAKLSKEHARKNAFGNTNGNILEAELTEKTYNNAPQVIYRLEEEHQGKFLGLFNIKARYEAEVNAQTGDVLSWDGPWWAFLITGEPQKPAVAKDEVYNYETCVAKTGISTDGIPSECTYKGKTYTEGATGYTQVYGPESWKEIIPPTCKRLYDGCNTCTRTEGGVGCTEIACTEYEIPRCLDEELKEEVYNFETCEAKTGISTDGVPRECTYQGRTYAEGVPGYVEGGSEGKETLGPEILILLGETKTIGTHVFEIISLGAEKVGFMITFPGMYNSISTKTEELEVGEIFTKPLWSGSLMFKIKEIFYEGANKGASIQWIIQDYETCKIAGYPTTQQQGDSATNEKIYVCTLPNGYKYVEPSSETIMMPEPQTVYNFETCEAKTGISTDGNPRECTYQGKTYSEGVAGYTKEYVATSSSSSTSSQVPQVASVFMVADLSSCQNNGGTLNSAGTSCSLNGATYTEQHYPGTDMASLCSQIGGTLQTVPYRCMDQNNVEHIFAMS